MTGSHTGMTNDAGPAQGSIFGWSKPIILEIRGKAVNGSQTVDKSYKAA